MLFGLLSHFLLGLVLGELLDILIQLSLVMCNIFLIILFLFDKMFAFGLDLVDLIFLVLDSLLISLPQVLNPFLEQFIFLQQFLVFLFLRFGWFGLFGELAVLVLELLQLGLAHVGVLDLYYLVVFFALALDLLFQGVDFSLQFGGLELVVCLAFVGLLRFVLFFQVFEFLFQLPDPLIKLK